MLLFYQQQEGNAGMSMMECLREYGFEPHLWESRSLPSPWKKHQDNSGYILSLDFESAETHPYLLKHTDPTPRACALTCLCGWT